ncbi:hypothetical protein [Halofilum ochraceum]|uniref:hypothetical protein n=1 Tax=Halofilum ochraceum TaxID=1611323 RepID=UPI0008DA76BE|nr:hypothetical protein [Halofilum ochraceum]
MSEEAEAIETTEETTGQQQASEPVPITGVIADARFGYTTSERNRFGLLVTFRRGPTIVGSYVVVDYPIEIRPGAEANWSENSRDRQYADAVRQLNRILRTAGKEHVAELPGTPVQLHIDDNRITYWRVLWEAL